jgi:hypothetical protein
MPEKITLLAGSGNFAVAGSEFVGWHFERPPTDHPIYSLVGRVASEWAHLEHSLDRIAWTLLGVISPRGAAVTSSLMGAAPRYKAILAQLEHRKHKDPQFEQYISKVTKLMQKTFDASESRNRIIHDPWYLDQKQGVAAQFKSYPAKDLRFGIREVDLKMIDETIAKIARLTEQSVELFVAINADVAATR